MIGGNDFVAVLAGWALLTWAVVIYYPVSGENVYDALTRSSTTPDTTTSRPAAWSSIDLLIMDSTNRSVSVAALGDPLELRLALSGTRYSSIMPRNCYFVNGRDRRQKISFVIDGCPKKLAADIGERMERISNTSYKLSFKAFTFVPAPITWVDIVCQVTLCITTNEELCTDKCWIPWSVKIAQRFARPGSFHGGSDGINNWTLRDNAESITEAVNLIVTSKNYSSATVPSPVWTPAAGNYGQDSDTTSTLLYILYGLTGFLAFLFIILLFGVICFLIFYSTKSTVTVATEPPLRVANVIKNYDEDKTPYFTVFRIPRVRSRYDSSSTYGGSSRAPLTSTSSLQWSQSVDSTRSTVLSHPVDLPEIIRQGQ